MIQAPLPLATVIAVTVALCFWLDRHVPVLSKIGAGMLAIIVGAALSNLGAVPAASPVYDAIEGPITYVAIAWLLLAVNIADVRRVGRRVLGAFGLACVGTALGAMIGAFIFAGKFGADNASLAGAFTGTYTGGSVNFVSVSRGLAIPPTLFAAANAADAAATALWMGATLLLPVWLARFYPPVPKPAEPVAGATDVEHPYFSGITLNTVDMALLVSSGLLLVLLANAAGRLVPGVPAVLWLTTFALAAGHLTPLGKVAGSLQFGNFALVFFFVVIGIHSRAAEIMAVGVDVFWFTLIIVTVHGLVVYGFGRIFRIDVASLSVASQAAVGGPPSALAVAVAREWPQLVLPGVIVGLLGYAVGTYLGFGIAGLVRALGM
jgi:uncharacterized membrane protein